ncbi:MAG: polyphosphate polymerase domain-containing protein [Bacteroidia bacterium]
MSSELNILNDFAPISLKEMDSVKLMNRTDTKFTFNRTQFDEVLQEIINDYSVLEIDGKRISRYKTLYYDTEAYDLYTKHHNGELNRYKIRHRSYLESDIGFLEVKFKSNKGRTVKDRIKKNDIPFAWENDTESFLQSLLPFDPQDLKPVIWVNYSRLTLVNKYSAERLTIDLNLEFVQGEAKKSLPNLVIAEVKQEKRKPSPFLKVMKKLHIREGSISKYCMGIALTTDDRVKKNNFKAKLLNLKHIIYDDLVTNS